MYGPDVGWIWPRVGRVWPRVGCRFSTSGSIMTVCRGNGQEWGVYGLKLGQNWPGMMQRGRPGLDQRCDYGRLARELPGVGCVWPNVGADMAHGGVGMAQGGVPGLASRRWP